MQKFFIFFLLFPFLYISFLSEISAKEISTSKKDVDTPVKQPPLHKKAKEEIKEEQNPDSSFHKKAEKDVCEAKGKKLLYSEKLTFSPLNFSRRIGKWVERSLNYIKRDKFKQCPKTCEQINNYQVLSKIQPKNVEKGSCKEKPAKESYSFKKKFTFGKGGHFAEKSHESMVEWILGTFVYSYIPLPLLEPTQEYKESNLPSACPSCSFYLDYSYKYTKDNSLALDIKARCGDSKKFMSDFKADFVLINFWSCESLEEKVSDKPLSAEQKKYTDPI